MATLRSPSAVLHHGWRRDGLCVLDAVAGVLLSVAVFVLVHVHLYASDPHGDVLAGLAATSMTLPLVFARRYPRAAAAAVAVGALVNWLVVGRYIRCGAAVPAGLWLACIIGLRLRGRAAFLAMVLVVADLQFICLADAALIPATILPLAPAAVAFWFAGRTIRSRGDAVRRIAEQNERLALTRERTAQLAVETDRARIRGGLDGQLQCRIDTIAATATSGHAHVADPSAAQAAFAAIAADGRRTLAQMREVVDVLRAQAPRAPLPDLSQLADLVSRHGGRLVIDGDRRPLPDGVELSGYRIVEQVLRALGSGSGSVAVHVRYGVDELELRIVGIEVTDSSAAPELAVAQQRIEVHGGELTAHRHTGRVHWVARIPLAAG